MQCIIKYVIKRWLSLEAAFGRALRLLSSFTPYFLSEEDKSPRFERLHQHFENPMLEAYLLFYQLLLRVLIKLNLLLHREDPLISCGPGNIQRFLKKLALKFLNLDVIDETITLHKSTLRTPTIKRAVMLKRVFYAD